MAGDPLPADSCAPRAGDIWLIRMKDPDLRAALVKVEVLEVIGKAAELDPMGNSNWAVSRGYYEPGKDFSFVQLVSRKVEEDELAKRRKLRG